MHERASWRLIGTCRLTSHPGCARRGDRVFQFWVKYQVAASVMLLLILIISDLVPEARPAWAGPRGAADSDM